MKRTDLAYVAGIIDGEGCISFSGNPTKSSHYNYILVQVVNTNEWLIRWLHMAFGGRFHLRKDKREKAKGWKPTYQWSIGSMDALKFLELVYPYLKIKKPQAEIAIKYLEMRGQKYRRLTSKERLVAEAQNLMLSELNKRGTKQ